MNLLYRVLTGPTAAGKTGWLLQRAQNRRIEAVSADSRQVYRGMDIGTGKPMAGELARLPHHLLDLLDPGESFSAHEFVIRAAEALRQLEQRRFDGEVWLCGGTGLYIRALTETLPLGPAPDPELRSALQRRISDLGPEGVADALGLETAERRNPVRVLRRAEALAADDPAFVAGFAGLEFGRTMKTRTPSASPYEQAHEYLSRWNCAGIYVLDPGVSLEVLIRRRVGSMFSSGLVDEVARLRGAGFGSAEVVRNGIAYAEAGLLLDGGIAEAEAIERAVIRTRQYAKRQRTYFRGRGWTFHTREQLDAAAGE